MPLYAQIATRVRVAIAAGKLKVGDPLPSVRRLAVQLRINPATVVQAYRELEDEGFAETRHGAGTFVREVTSDKRSRERGRQARNLVHQLITDARKAGLSTADLIEALQEALGAKRL